MEKWSLYIVERDISYQSALQWRRLEWGQPIEPFTTFQSKFFISIFLQASSAIKTPYPYTTPQDHSPTSPCTDSKYSSLLLCH
ncbi:hypothetical protein NPIL_85501 [Nephila pilipes]|uniref:Uncharacterized protein n=1 Tax=Nephila pilipes TaxID=299642 RepID=A0A8X6PE10_NEPPI|nr:hypothetical protein NPIL_85501 [Nephila pilipes]